MANQTLLDYDRWGAEKELAQIEEFMSRPAPTSAQFWKAAYEYDPLSPNAPDGPNALREIISSGRAGPYTIGKLWGHTTLKLIPAMGALQPPSSSSFQPPFEYAATDSGAISYPDGHPSEEMFAPDYATSSAQGKISYTIKAQEDDKLRRFAALGWVIVQNGQGVWEKTGHVLVIDMDDRASRQRHPWFVLASEWPTDGEETSEGDFIIRAPAVVTKDDPSQAGVFQGDNNRTPICQIVPHGRELKDGKNFLEQLGDIDIAPERKGGHRRGRRTEKGPALAKIMDWYWDPKREQEVCYATEGYEYMRYDRQLMEYSFPDF
ncbi:MAG: hypothetical protein Q9211_001291 [Gyalolechia sp. 1 TL-2023]